MSDSNEFILENIGLLKRYIVRKIVKLWFLYADFIIGVFNKETLNRKYVIIQQIKNEIIKKTITRN